MVEPIFFIWFIGQWFLGLFYSNFAEWAVHKYVLHGLGKNKRSLFAFHWHDHHRAARKNQFYDSVYEGNFKIKWNARSKEVLGLFLMWFSHIWIFLFAPVFFLAITYSVINYYQKHKKAHTDPEWAKKHLKHHWDHHQGKNQNKNWCVTRPWCDILFGTREHVKDE